MTPRSAPTSHEESNGWEPPGHLFGLLMWCVGWQTWLALIGLIAARLRTTSHLKLAREDKAKPERTGRVSC